MVYYGYNSTRQFVTILSINKTRRMDGGIALIFYGMGAIAPIFSC